MHSFSSMWPIVLTNFSLEPFEEDVFEAMSCYFPIDFSPPKGLEVLISKEDLVTGLRQCLSTSGIFAPLAMPLYMEKLDSDLNDAKVDANLTMIESMKKYSPEQVKPHLAELWGLLKKEILGIKMSVDDEVIGSCYLLIHQVTLTLSRALQSMDNREILEENWLNMVWQDIGRHLQGNNFISMLKVYLTRYCRKIEVFLQTNHSSRILRAFKTLFTITYTLA